MLWRAEQHKRQRILRYEKTGFCVVGTYTDDLQNRIQSIMIITVYLVCFFAFLFNSILLVFSKLVKLTLGNIYLPNGQYEVIDDK